MSAWATTWAYEQAIKRCGEKSVLVALAHFSDAEGFCYPGQELLADMTSQGISTVRAHLESLENSGFIKRGHRYKKGKRTSDGYYLQAPADRLQPQKHYRQKSALVQNELPPEKSVLPPDPAHDLLGDPLEKERTPVVPIQKPRRDEPLTHLPFAGEEFTEALAEFESHLKENGKRLGATRRKSLYAMMEIWGEDLTTEALKTSVLKGWTSVDPFYGRQNSSQSNGHSRSPQPLKYRDYLREDDLFIYQVGPEGPDGMAIKLPKGPEGMAKILGVPVEEVLKNWN